VCGALFTPEQFTIIVYQNKCVFHQTLYMTLIIAKDLTEKRICLLCPEYVQVVMQKMSGLSKLYYIRRAQVKVGLRLERHYSQR